MRKADRILEEAYVIDGHLDLGLTVEVKYHHGERNVLMHDYYDRLKKGHVDCIVSALFADTKYLPDHGVRQTMEQIALIYDEVARSEGRFVIVRSTEEMRRARANGQISVLLAIEGIEAIEGRLPILGALYELGVRIISPCWSRTTWAADGARFLPPGEYEGTGLTAQGRELVSYCEEKGILLDVSHCNAKSFWDIARMATKPFVATHSNSCAVSPVDRNLDDDQIRFLAEKGGTMGLNGASIIARYQDPEHAGTADLIAHLLHEKHVGGIACVAIGLDQGDHLNPYVDELRDMPLFDILPSHAMLPDFAEELLGRGLQEDEIRGVFGENLLRVLQKTIN